jgi:hypothetical protein
VQAVARGGEGHRRRAGQRISADDGDAVLCQVRLWGCWGEDACEDFWRIEEVRAVGDQ